MKTILTCLFLTVMSVALAEDDRTLFTIDGEDVKVSEFEYIYNKNNFDNKADYSKESLDEYLDLFIRFRLKVREAEELDYDKDANLMSELNTYKRQLYESYFDKQVTSKLVNEALERMKKDISLSHIFIPSKDRDGDIKKKEARKLVDEVYRKLENGESFEQLAKQYSKDNYSANNGGDLGYFTGLQISHYPLENAAYSTPVGTYSEPIKTKIGYHIVKVNDERPSRGKIKVAIIKKKFDKKVPSSYQAAERSIQSAHDLLNKGEDFTKLAKSMSDDKITASKGGELDWFGISEYNQPFEDAAFGLEEDGDYTEPIELNGGWYIIKRLGHKDYEEIVGNKEKITESVKKSDRYALKRAEYFKNILDSYGHIVNEDNLDAYKSEVVERLTPRGMSLEPKDNPKVILTIGENEFDENDFEKFIARNFRRTKSYKNEERFDELFDFFIDERTILYHQDKLAEEDNGYAALLNEYRDGILLFELTEKEIWSKAVEDTIGLQQFFESNRDLFKWNKRAEVALYELENEKQQKVGKKLLKKLPKLGSAKVLSKLEGKGVNIEEAMTKIFEAQMDEKADIQYIEKAAGITEMDNKTYFYVVESIQPEEYKELSQVRGFAIAAYQEYLEDAWIEKLQAKYPIEINYDILNSLIKK